MEIMEEYQKKNDDGDDNDNRMRGSLTANTSSSMTGEENALIALLLALVRVDGFISRLLPSLVRLLLLPDDAEPRSDWPLFTLLLGADVGGMASGRE